EGGDGVEAGEVGGQAEGELGVRGGVVMYKSGDVGGAGRRLGDIPPGAPGTEDPFVATVHRLVHGISWMWLGDSGHARELLAEAARRAEADGNRLAYIYAQGCPALMAVDRA